MKALLHAETRRQRFLYLTVSGLISGFCMAFPTLFGAVIEWISFIPAALAIYSAIEKRVSLKSAYWGGFWLIYAQQVIVYHWFISFYPLEFTGMSKLSAAGVVIVAIFGLALLAAMFGGVYGLVIIAISRLPIAKKYPILMPIVAASGYVLNEWIRTQFWFGVPWGRLSLGQLNDGIPISVLSSSIFGSYFITFLIVLVSFLLAQALVLGRFKLRPIIALSLVAANLLCGTIIALIPIKEETTVTVAAIQGNVSSRDKWDGGTTSADIFSDYANLSVNAAIDGAELIVWPETSLPSNGYIPYISQICEEYGVYILFGTFHYDDDGNPANVLRLIDPNGELSDIVYSKRHLVPFGEYVPMRKLIMTVFPPLGEIAMLENDLIPGDSSELYEIEINGKTVRVGGLICFDSIYEELAYASAADGADILCVSTNDSWFEDSRAVYMHCAQSRLRAIETGLPVLRSANTGISAVITQKGEVLETIEPLVQGYIVEDITVDSTKANSNMVNGLFLWLCAASIAVWPIIDLCSYLSSRRK